ncbi:Pleckstrin homology domain-containing protein [Diplogelasinospora grovesii]|uniref:Pleckstrin homology domain-containing protein n=1 Tax=Diplogelasinospora grovesii TaxID=303347 RepID=A0AAN6N7T2_9PEZI|nr:Pleckstrin homology domain-containing protein [Diplogelasinospora grovesii]
MAEQQKPVEIPQETVPATEPVTETAPATEAVPATTEATTTAEAAPPAAAETTEAPAAATEEAAKEEAKPIEEGSLEHKGQGTNFPKNLIFSKKFFWFGSEAVDLKSVHSFKADKAIETAHHVIAWAAETGKGLLFFSEKSDKTAPHGAIHLADVSEPATDGSNKFHFTAKGHKHNFKAASTAERDNWVAQLKAKIAEAKELVATVTESETYKKTLESLKPAAAKKEEKAVAAEPATEAAAPAATAEEAAPTTEAATEEAKVEEPKRRSASRKRGSIFGLPSFGGKKDEKKSTEALAETEAPAAESAVIATEAPAVENVAEAAPEAAAAVEPAAPAETKAEEKPAASKRTSIFGNLSFGKKKPVEAEAAPAKEAPATTEAVAETAPVIPAVETTEPLSAEVSSPATAPTETVDATPAVNGEMKSDKRKSSLPFAFGKKDKPTSDEESEPRSKSPSAFSRIRATIKGNKKAEKAAAPEEAPAAAPEVEANKDGAAASAEEAPKPAEPAAAATEEAVPKPVEATPAVTAAA